MSASRGTVQFVSHTRTSISDVPRERTLPLKPAPARAAPRPGRYSYRYSRLKCGGQAVVLLCVEGLQIYVDVRRVRLGIRAMSGHSGVSAVDWSQPVV